MTDPWTTDVRIDEVRREIFEDNDMRYDSDISAAFLGFGRGKVYLALHSIALHSTK